MNEYQEQILDHYHNPRNFGVPLWPYTHSFKLQNLSCGDEVEFFLLVKDNKIENISFTGEGCSISIASASLLSEEFKNKKLNEVLDLKPEHAVTLIGIPLTISRIKCATLPLETVQKALGNYSVA